MNRPALEPSPTPGRHPRQAARAFTLVEMLTVMAIIAILLGVTIPAIRGINGTGSRKSAVRTMMGVLDQARMLAISDGKATYVVFAGSNLVGTAADTMVGHSYAVFEDNASFAPVQRSAWINLPAGVSFKVASDFDTLVNRPLAASEPTFNVVSPKGGEAVTVTRQLPYIKFDSTGAVDAALANDAEAQHFRVLLFDGIVTSTGTENSTRSASTDLTRQNFLFDEIRINPATGRAKYTLDPSDNLSPTA